MTTPRKSHAYGINLAVAQALTDAYKAADMTQESLAARLPNISLTSLNRYLKGRSAIDVEVLSAICAAIGVSELEILTAAERSKSAPTPAQQREVDAAISVVDQATRKTRPARTKHEMQQMDDRAARDEDTGA